MSRSPGRILVYGVTGSGKSTAAVAIGSRTGLPVTLVDEITWLPGWVPVDGQAVVRTPAPAAGVRRGWQFRSFARKRSRMRAWAADPGMPQVLLLRRPRELEKWLANLDHSS